MRVHFSLSVLSACFATLTILQGCTSLPKSQLQPVYAHPADNERVHLQKIVRFKDSLGAVSEGRNQAMLTAFDYCARESRLAFVTKPLPYFEYVNYSNISTYSIRDAQGAEATSSPEFVAPFTCIDQKHTAFTGILASEDMPRGVIIHEAAKDSCFQINDIVIKVGTNKIKTRAELARAVDVAPVGSLTFEVMRSGKSVVIPQTVVDSTASVQKTARILLSALCKGESSQACENGVALRE